jgi:hypothetical protein
MAKYDAQATSASKLIAKKGVAVTLSRAGSSYFDPVTQADVATTQTFLLTGVFLPAGKSAEFKVGSLEGRNVVECYFAKSASATPAPGDTFSFQGHRWEILNTTTYDPAGDGSVMTQAYAQR